MSAQTLVKPCHQPEAGYDSSATVTVTGNAEDIISEIIACIYSIFTTFKTKTQYTITKMYGLKIMLSL